MASTTPIGGECPETCAGCCENYCFTLTAALCPIEDCSGSYNLPRFGAADACVWDGTGGVDDCDATIWCEDGWWWLEIDDGVGTCLWRMIAEGAGDCPDGVYDKVVDGCGCDPSDATITVSCCPTTTPVPEPSTGAPTTVAPTTQPPTTEPPTTAVPTTQAPTTRAPTTPAATTPGPTTEPPPTEAPTTEPPTTEPPTTEPGTTEAPTTQPPTTSTYGPATELLTTERPTTVVPTTTTLPEPTTTTQEGPCGPQVEGEITAPEISGMKYTARVEGEKIPPEVDGEIAAIEVEGEMACD